MPGFGLGSPDDPQAAAFLTGFKYRLLVHRSFADRLSGAVFVAGQESQPVRITELPGMFLVEVPVS